MAGFKLYGLFVLAVLCLLPWCDCVPVARRHRRDVQDLPHPHEPLYDSPIVGSDTSQLSAQPHLSETDQSEQGLQQAQTQHISPESDDLPVHNADSEYHDKVSDSGVDLHGDIDIEGQGDRHDLEQGHLNPTELGQIHGRRDLDYDHFETRSNGSENHHFMFDGEGTGGRQGSDGDAPAGKVSVNSSSVDHEEHPEYEQHPFLLSSEVGRLPGHDSSVNASAETIGTGHGSSSETVKTDHDSSGEAGHGPGIESTHTDHGSSGETINAGHSTGGSEINGTNVESVDGSHTSAGETSNSGGSHTSAGETPNAGDSSGHENPETEISSLNHLEENSGDHAVDENNEHTGVESGVDVPINKGRDDQGHHDTNDEHEPVVPRHTNSHGITSATTGTTPNFPITEPHNSTATAKLVILPTPAQPEQSERESMTEGGEINHDGSGENKQDKVGDKEEGDQFSTRSSAYAAESFSPIIHGVPNPTKSMIKVEPSIHSIPDTSSFLSSKASHSSQHEPLHASFATSSISSVFVIDYTTELSSSLDYFYYDDTSSVFVSQNTGVSTSSSSETEISVRPTRVMLLPTPSTSIAQLDTHTPSSPRTPDTATHTPSSPRAPDTATHMPTAPRAPDTATHPPSSPRTPDMATHTPRTPDTVTHMPTSPSTPDTATSPSTSSLHVNPTEQLPADRNTHLVTSQSVPTSITVISPSTSSSIYRLPTASVDVVIDHQSNKSTASTTDEQQTSSSHGSNFPTSSGITGVPVPSVLVSESSSSNSPTRGTVTRSALNTSTAERGSVEVSGTNFTRTAATTIMSTSNTSSGTRETVAETISSVTTPRPSVSPPVITQPAIATHTQERLNSSTPASTEPSTTSRELNNVTGSPTTRFINGTDHQPSAVTNGTTLIPVPTLSMTTKRKPNMDTNGTQSSTLGTTKKITDSKVSVKPDTSFTYNNTNTTRFTNRSSTRPTGIMASTRTIVTTGSPQTVKTTQRPALTTPPPVFIRISIRMSWVEFCGAKSHFITELRQIIHTEKQVSVEYEQFKIKNEYCSSAHPIMSNEGSLNQIIVEMFIVDVDGKLDITLTIDASKAIIPGFRDSLIFKDKIVEVHLNDMRQVAQSPETEEHPSAKEMPTGVTMVIVIAAVGGCCCVVIIVLQVIIHRRVAAKKMRPYTGHRASLQSMDHVALGVIPKSRPNSGYWNPALDNHEEVPEPKEHSHLVNFAILANFCMDVTGIHEEFQTIPFDNPGLSSVPVGEEDKNRFANVLPHKHTRVRLKKREGDLSDYINANYVTGYKGDKGAYIATQSPLVNTVEDFWRMVWEQQSRAILMLNPVLPTGKPRQSTCYWPNDEVTDSMREYGDFTVTLKKKDVQQDYVDCTLEIMDIERNLKREVHHFWLTCWPDVATPEPLAFVKFVLDTRPHYEDSRAPVVVHCGPGTGRTGTLIAVDICMRMFENKRCADIKNSVHKMRGERAGSVQSKEQYALIYQALNEYAVILSSPSVSTRSSVITLHAML